MVSHYLYVSGSHFEFYNLYITVTCSIYFVIHVCVFSLLTKYIYSMLKTKVTDKPRVGWVCL